MRETKVICGLTEIAGKDRLVIKVSGGNASLVTHVDFDLADKSAEGYTGFSQTVGNAVLQMLINTNDDVFGKYPLLTPPDFLFGRPQHMIAALVRFSYVEKTAIYVEAIDQLIEKHGVNFGNTDLCENWRSKYRPDIIRLSSSV